MCLAEERGESRQQIEMMTTENAHRAFRLGER